MNSIHKYLLIIISFTLFACAMDEPEKVIVPQPVKQEVIPEKVIVPTPDFNADSAYAFIQNQVDFGPRVPMTASHDSCGKWLIDKLQSYGFEMIIQEGVAKAWTGDLLDMTNIMGQFNPEAVERIVLFAHWDTRPYADKDSTRKYEPIDGANDGGSGVGVLLEIARQVSILSPGYGVDIVFFDAEDYGTFQADMYQDLQQMKHDWCLGSQYWALNLPVKNYKPRYGILLDMVGAPDAKFPKESVSLKYAKTHVNNLWNKAAELGYGDKFVKNMAGGITDDHVYINSIAKIKTLDIIDMRPSTDGNYYGFGSFHHTHGDNMDVIDKGTLKAVGQTVLAAIYEQI
jgi:glutaminyl-peptide cyclotransferase